MNSATLYRVLSTLSMTALIGSLACACAHNDKPAEEPKGPAQKAGEKVDETAHEAKEKTENAADKAGDKVEEATDKDEK
jgi:hypothetical protein